MSKDFFNKKAKEWDEITEHSQEVILKVFKKIPDLDEPNILDVGCGTGVLIKFLLQNIVNQPNLPLLIMPRI